MATTAPLNFTVIPDNYDSYINKEIKTIESFTIPEGTSKSINVDKPIIINGIILTEEELARVKTLHASSQQNMVIFESPDFKVNIEDTKHKYTIPFKIGKGDNIPQGKDTIFLSYFQIAKDAKTIDPDAPKKFGFFKFKVGDFIRNISMGRKAKKPPQALEYPLTVEVDVVEQSARAKDVAASTDKVRSVQCAKDRESLLENLKKIKREIESEYGKFEKYKGDGCPTNSGESAGTSSPKGPTGIAGTSPPKPYVFPSPLNVPAGTSKSSTSKSSYILVPKSKRKARFTSSGTSTSPPKGPNEGMAGGRVVKRKRNIKKRTRRLSVIRRNKRGFFRKKTLRKKNKRMTRKIRKYQGRE